MLIDVDVLGMSIDKKMILQTPGTSLGKGQTYVTTPNVIH